MSAATETCRCGAHIEVQIDDRKVSIISLGQRLDEFRAAHATCRAQPTEETP